MEKVVGETWLLVKEDHGTKVVRLDPVPTAELVDGVIEARVCHLVDEE